MISIIIPAYNEETVIGPLIRYLKKTGNSQEIGEIIVVDGGSRDDTVPKAGEAGADLVVSSRKGRACQMNTGAAHAKGDILYFLHADTFPPSSFVRDIISAYEGGFHAGCFRLQFENKHWLLRFYGWCTRFDIPAFRFGDQSLFIEKKLFEEVGRFREQLIVMEDNEIIQRLRKRSTFRIIPKTVTTSSRKYQKNGYVRLQLVFTMIYCLYHLGIPQEQLVKIYKEYIYQ